MHEHDTLVFLLSLAMLLGVARLLGELGRSLGLPLVVGELSAGFVLGATGLGRIWPEGYAFILPRGAPAQMLDGYTTIGVVLLLVVAGLEVDLGIVKRRGKSALLIATLGMAFPLIGGFALGHFAPDSFVGSPEHRDLFAIFLGVALSISALPVIAKTLLDLGLLKTEIGLLIMTAAMINDLVGWVAFSVLLGPMRGGGVDLGHLGLTLALAFGFTLACFVIGRPLVDRVLAHLDGQADIAPGRILSLVIVVALVAATATHAIGIHAVLGGFIAGVVIGESRRLRERTRQTIQQFVTNVFAPVFFASVALRVDIIENFDPILCLSVFVVACLTKIIGCAVGARLSGMAFRESFAIAFGLNSRGAMEIILAILARDAGLIGDHVFVALVAMAIGTSLLAAPAMKRFLYDAYPARPPQAAGGPEDAAGLVRAGAFVPRLAATTSARAIEELGNALRDAIGDLVEPALIAVLEREIIAPTGLGDEVAIPHAAVAGLGRPVVALGLSQDGIDFDAPDGRAARIVFLLLLPPKAFEKEVRVLGALARSVYDEDARAAISKATSLEEAVKCLDEHTKRLIGTLRPPPTTNLTDI